MALAVIAIGTLTLSTRRPFVALRQTLAVAHDARCLRQYRASPWCTRDHEI